MDLRELIRIKDYSEDTYYKLLDAVDRQDWVERILDVIKELDDKSIVLSSLS